MFISDYANRIKPTGVVIFAVYIALYPRRDFKYKSEHIVLIIDKVFVMYTRNTPVMKFVFIIV